MPSGGLASQALHFAHMRLRFRLGDIIRNLREQKGWGQKELAAAAHVSLISVSRLESNAVETKPETVRKVALALGVRVSEIQAALEQLEHLQETQRPLPTGTAGPGFRDE